LSFENSTVLTGLPRQYSRLHGGAEELKADMIKNLSPFGHAVDCGLISGISDTFTGRGYAILEAPDQRSSDSSSFVTPKLQHSVHWQFTQLSIRPSARNNDYSDATTVYANWSSMDPYCRYCHSQAHILADCEKRLSSILSYNCNASGHISRLCPRRNTLTAGASNKRSRKVPYSNIERVPNVTPASSSVTTIAEPITSAPTQAVDPITTHINSGSNNMEDNRESLTNRLTSNTNTHQTRSQTKKNEVVDRLVAPQNTDQSNGQLLNNDASGSESSAPPPICKHCNLSGHQRSNHSACLKNPRNLGKSQLIEEQEREVTEFDNDIVMIDDTTSANDSQSLITHL
jgi:hypothetical protein